MRELYRKRGRVVRWENGRIVRVTECGVAMENERFICYPDPDLASSEGSSLDSARVEATARAIRIPEGIRLERMIVSEGEADHTFRDRAWHETTRRIHLALAKGRFRVLIDLADFDLEPIAPVAEALARAEEGEREAPPRLRLAPAVSAAFLPSLVGLAPPNVTLAQRAGGIDGKGNPIEDATAPWPNWYRPSYRVRPARMPFNLTAACDVMEIDEARPMAIALVAPPSALTLRVLVVEGDRVYPSTVRVARIDAISEPRRWYPYGAGVWGAEMTL